MKRIQNIANRVFAIFTKTNEQKLAKRLRSATAQEIILAMVDSVRNPITKLDMLSFGHIDKDGNCHACIATNTVCKLGGYSHEDLKSLGGFFEPTKENETIKFFELAVNRLRQGKVELYNIYAEEHNFALIKDVDFELPFLSNSWNETMLSRFEKLASLQ